jgi:hypothetical protein
MPTIKLNVSVSFKCKFENREEIFIIIIIIIIIILWLEEHAEHCVEEKCAVDGEKSVADIGD